jgi:hypothetical protein
MLRDRSRDFKGADPVLSPQCAVNEQDPPWRLVLKESLGLLKVACRQKLDGENSRASLETLRLSSMTRIAAIFGRASSY